MLQKKPLHKFMEKIQLFLFFCFEYLSCKMSPTSSMASRAWKVIKWKLFFRDNITPSVLLSPSWNDWWPFTGNNWRHDKNTPTEQGQQDNFKFTWFETLHSFLHPTPLMSLLLCKEYLYLYITQVWASLNCSASYFTGFQNSFSTASQLCYCPLTLSNISRVWAADKQNLVRDSIRGVAGNPTTTTAMFLFNISRPNALKKENNGFLFYNQRPTKKLAQIEPKHYKEWRF